MAPFASWIPVEAANSQPTWVDGALAIEANVESGSTVDLSLSNGELKIKPIDDREYTLEELLSGITLNQVFERKMKEYRKMLTEIKDERKSA